MKEFLNSLQLRIQQLESELAIAQEKDSTKNKDEDKYD